MGTVRRLAEQVKRELKTALPKLRKTVVKKVAGPANLGFDWQNILLERVRNWLPGGADVLLLADRFYPSVELFEWLHARGWHYRLRLKGNLNVDPGFGDITTTGV